MIYYFNINYDFKNLDNFQEHNDVRFIWWYQYQINLKININMY